MTQAKKRGNGLVFTFEHDGSIKLVAAGIGEHRFHPREASLECNSQATLKGWKSTFEDAAAKSRDPATGASAPLEERFAASVAIMKHYADKSVTVWGRKATGVRESNDVGMVLQALMRIWKRDLDGVEAALAKLATKHETTRDEQLKGLAKAKDVVRVIGEIKAERAAANKAIDAASLIDELDELDEEADGDEADGEGDEDPADETPPEAPEAPF